MDSTAVGHSSPEGGGASFFEFCAFSVSLSLLRLERPPLLDCVWVSMSATAGSKNSCKAQRAVLFNMRTEQFSNDHHLGWLAVCKKDQRVATFWNHALTLVQKLVFDRTKAQSNGIPIVLCLQSLHLSKDTPVKESHPKKEDWCNQIEGPHKLHKMSLLIGICCFFCFFLFCLNSLFFY